MVPCSTMKANAMVTIARYGPVTRKAGSASSAPTTPASAPAIGKASQKLTPFRVRIAAV